MGGWFLRLIKELQHHINISYDAVTASIYLLRLASMNRRLPIARNMFIGYLDEIQLLVDNPLNNTIILECLCSQLSYLTSEYIHKDSNSVYINNDRVVSIVTKDQSTNIYHWISAVDYEEMNSDVIEIYLSFMLYRTTDEYRFYRTLILYLLMDVFNSFGTDNSSYKDVSGDIKRSSSVMRNYHNVVRNVIFDPNVILNVSNDTFDHQSEISQLCNSISTMTDFTNFVDRIRKPNIHLTSEVLDQINQL
jgi:hypothetical protein